MAELAETAVRTRTQMTKATQQPVGPPDADNGDRCLEKSEEDYADYDSEVSSDVRFDLAWNAV